MKPSIVVQAVCGCLLLALRGAAAEGLGSRASLRPQRLRSLLAARANVTALAAALQAPAESFPRETGAEDDEEQQELDKIHEIEETLISLKADKAAGRITPAMANFIATVKNVIKEEMIPKIEEGHKSAVAMLKSVHSGFSGCAMHRSTAKAAIATMGTTRTSARSSHGKCRAKESVALAARQGCWKVVKEKLRRRDIACKAYKTLLKNPDDDADNCHTTVSSERYGSWLKRNRNWFEAKWAQIQKNKKFCEDAKLQFERVQGPCNKKKIRWMKTKALCIKKQRRLEMSSCTLAKKTWGMCNSYSDCYEKQLDLYESQVPLIKTQEKDRKVEWRALKRIECLVSEVFQFGGAVPSEIEKCTSKVSDTSHLDLKYPEKPGKDSSACLPLPPVPGTRSFSFKEYRRMPKGTKPVPSDQCIVNPGGGMKMYVAKLGDKSKCQVKGDWLSASNRGSCLIAGKGGYPVAVDYTRKRFTRYRFTMKMQEESTRDGVQDGGGFSVCNLDGPSSSMSSSPGIVFRDTFGSRWGYGLANFRKPEETKVAKCDDLLVKYQVWGKEAAGLDVGKYTGGTMKWIGCNGDGCESSSFFCEDDGDGQGIVFGSTGTLRALLGEEVPKEASKGCCSADSKDGVCNAMNVETDVEALCQSLGYSAGTLLEKGPGNKCPQVRWDQKESAWTSNFRSAGGPGKKFRCQTPLSQDLYTDKGKYKSSEPKNDRGRSWDLVMEYADGVYKFRSLTIEGVSYDGYKGMVAKCPVDRTSARVYFGFTPRITTLTKNGKVSIKDFRVFQGDDLKEPLKQVVGVGFGEKAAQRKTEKKAAKKAVKKFIAKLRRQEKNEKYDPGVRNDMKKVADWVDKESLCTSQMTRKNLFGVCAKVKSDRVGIWIKYANGLEGFAAYDGVADLWNKGGFKKLEASVSTGFFSKCKGLHFLNANGNHLPMAWVGCSNKYSRNFDLDYSPKKCSDWRADKKGWERARIRLYCKM